MISHYELEKIITLENSAFREGMFDKNACSTHLDQDGVLFVLLNSRLHKVNLNTGQQDSVSVPLEQSVYMAKLDANVFLAGFRKEQESYVPVFLRLSESGEFAEECPLSHKSEIPEVMKPLKGQLFCYNRELGFFRLNTANQGTTRINPLSRIVLDLFDKPFVCLSQDESHVFFAKGSSYGSNIYLMQAADNGTEKPIEVYKVGYKEITAMDFCNSFLFWHRIGGGGSSYIDAAKVTSLDGKASFERCGHYIPMLRNGSHFAPDFHSNSISASQISGNTILASVHKNQVFVLSVKYREH